MTAKDAYKYFVLKAQEIAISKKWTPVNWYVLFYVNKIVVSFLNLILTYNILYYTRIYLRVWKVLGYRHKGQKWKINGKIKNKYAQLTYAISKNVHYSASNHKETKGSIIEGEFMVITM